MRRGRCNLYRITPRFLSQRCTPRIYDFHRELGNGIEQNMMDNAAFPGLADLISFHDQEWGSPVFTHGDLSSLNMANGDIIIGIIDWETAGWMPPY